MFTLIIFLIILSILVIVHEYGHFITARKAGMKVYEFGLGFPPRAFGVYKDPVTKKWVWVRGKGKNRLSETVGGADRTAPEEFPATLYSINWLPLGGFVKIKGENGEAAQDPDSFGSHPAWKKLIVLLAGVVMNFLLAAVLLSVGFGIGLQSQAPAADDPHAIVVEEPGVIIQYVEADSPADEAGISFGERLLAINGEPLSGSADAISFIAQNADQAVTLTLQTPAGETMQKTLTPRPLDGVEQPRLGVMLADAGIVRYPWYVAMYKGFVGAGIALVNIFMAFGILLKNLLTGVSIGAEVAGPVGIAVIVGQSAKIGFSYLLYVTAMISLSLTAINVLPIPALDGGRALFVILEKLFGRPVPMRYEQLAHTIGFILLMILIVIVTLRDIVRLF